MFHFIFAFIAVLACTQSIFAGILPGHSAALNSEGYDYTAPTNALTSARLVPPVTSVSTYSEVNSYREPVSHNQASAQLTHNAYSTGAKYSNGQHTNGQYSNGQLSNGQYATGQHSNGQYATGQHSNGQYNNGQLLNGQYTSGQYSNGQNAIVQHSNGQYTSGQYSNGRNANSGRKVIRITNSYTTQRSAPLVKALYSAPLTDASAYRAPAATYHGYNGELLA